MKFSMIFFIYLLSVAVVYCKHTFLGTNVQRPLMYHKELKYSANAFTKRIETFRYSLPHNPNLGPQYIQSAFSGRLRTIIDHDSTPGLDLFKRLLTDVPIWLEPNIRPRPNWSMNYKGILAYDLTNSGATANVTEGGIGSNTVHLRMKSDRGKKLQFDVYVYA